MTNKLQLISNHWTPDQVAYIIWLATPKLYRDPSIKTERAYARVASIHRGTLWAWKQIPGFREEVTRLARSLLGYQLPEVLQSLENEAVKGSLGHQRLYLELMGITGPQLDPMLGVKWIIGARLEDV